MWLQAQARQAATDLRHERLQDPNLTNAEKRAVQVEHIYKWRRGLFSCPTCWLQPHFCVCRQLEKINVQTKVVVHVHHTEWCAARICWFQTPESAASLSITKLHMFSKAYACHGFDTSHQDRRGAHAGAGQAIQDAWQLRACVAASSCCGSTQSTTCALHKPALIQRAPWPLSFPAKALSAPRSCETRLLERQTAG